MRRSIAAVGRTLITLGLLILLFVAYQLWGTGIVTARAQDNLAEDFARQKQEYEASLSTSTTTTTTVPETPTTGPASTGPLTGPPPPIPKEGEVAGTIKIPKIGVDWNFVEGTSRADLRKGPGHYPETPMPGTLGNAAIAGHRTTYGAPFHRIDELVPGDKILISTVVGDFTYEMTEQLIVRPTDTYVVDNTPDAQLTLTSCHPKYSASRRIVVKAKLVPNESAKPAKPLPPKQPTGGEEPDESLVSDGLSGERRSAAPAARWGIVVLLVGGLWWWAFRRWRHPVVWALGAIPFVVVLFPFYMFLEQALPAGY